MIGGFLLWLFISYLTGTLCWVQAVVGLPCPGCGSIRAASELFHGNFTNAHIHHPLIIISLLLYIYLPLRFIFGRKRPLTQYEKFLLLGVVSLYLIVFIIRMILLFPHTQPLVPYENAVWRQVLVVFKQFIC